MQSNLTRNLISYLDFCPLNPTLTRRSGDYAYSVLSLSLVSRTNADASCFDDHNATVPVISSNEEVLDIKQAVIDAGNIIYFAFSDIRLSFQI